MEVVVFIASGGPVRRSSEETRKGVCVCVCCSSEEVTCFSWVKWSDTRWVKCGRRIVGVVPDGSRHTLLRSLSLVGRRTLRYQADFLWRNKRTLWVTILFQTLSRAQLYDQRGWARGPPRVFEWHDPVLASVKQASVSGFRDRMKRFNIPKE